MGAMFEGKVYFFNYHYIVNTKNISPWLHTVAGTQRMWKKCIIFTFFDRELVRQIMRTLDPVGVSLRKGNKLKRRQYLSKGFSLLFTLNVELHVQKFMVYNFCSIHVLHLD